MARSGKQQRKLRRGVEQQFDLIEFRIFWERHSNRSNLMVQFGVSVNQALIELNRYSGFAPNNMVCNKNARTCVRGLEYVPHFLKPDTSRYLEQLQSSVDGILGSDDSWIADLPSFDATPASVRRPNPFTLRDMVGPIRRTEALKAKYQSVASPEPHWRWLAPHAIGFDGFYWHARAFCQADEVCKDFLLSRIIKTRGVRASEVSDAADADWQEHVTLEIGLHPEPSDTQKQVIALDYGMRGGMATARAAGRSSESRGPR